MAIDPLSIIGLAAQGIKAGWGGISSLTGRSHQKNLWSNRPRLGITAGERDNDNLIRQMASSVELPGQRQYIDQMDEAVASGVYDAQRTASSSLGATQAAVDLNKKKMDAVRDLVGAFSEFKQQQKERLANWNSQKIDLEQQRWQQNEMLPWEIQMNEAVDRKKKGFEMFGKGLDSGLGMLGDLAGTKQMTDLYELLFGLGKYANKGNQSKPLQSGYDPQKKLQDTLSGMTNNIKINW